MWVRNHCVPEDFRLTLLTATAIDALDTNLVPSTDVHVQVKPVVVNIPIVSEGVRNLRHIRPQHCVVTWRQGQRANRMIHISEVLIRQLTNQKRITFYVCIRNINCHIGIVAIKCSSSNCRLSRCCSYVSNLLQRHIRQSQVRINQQPCSVDKQVVGRLHSQGLSLRIVCHHDIFHAVRSVTGEIIIINPEQETCLSEVLTSGEGHLIGSGIQRTLNPSIWQIFRNTLNKDLISADTNLYM